MTGNVSCPCGCGKTVSIGVQTILDSAERWIRQQVDPNYSIYVTSGGRCEAHNASVGGSPNSAHTLGLAADISTPTSRIRYALIYHLLVNCHIKRFDMRTDVKNPLNRFVHMDIATGPVPHPTDDLKEYPQEVIVDW
jgi:Peptidase M15